MRFVKGGFLAALLSFILASCDPGSSSNSNSIVKSLISEGPSGGYLIEPTGLDDFKYDGVMQLGALYIVRYGKTLSSKDAVQVQLACAVIPEYGSFVPFDGHPMATNLTTKIGGNIGIPKLFKNFLGGVSVSADAEYNVEINVNNLTYSYLGNDSSNKLNNILKSSGECKKIISRIDSNSRGSLFQLAGIISADIDGTITRSGGLNANVLGTPVLSPSGKWTHSFNQKKMAFKVFKAVH